MSTKSRMKIHIIGAGPTGMSLAWEILKSGEDHDITIYDRKTSAGGSWWEPEIDVRNIHAHRVLFNTFHNTQSLFDEMNIDWDEMFEPVNDQGGRNFLLKSLNVSDYVSLIKLVMKVLFQPSTRK